MTLQNLSTWHWVTADSTVVGLSCNLAYRHIPSRSCWLRDSVVSVAHIAVYVVALSLEGHEFDFKEAPNSRKSLQNTVGTTHSVRGVVMVTQVSQAHSTKDHKQYSPSWNINM